MSTAVGRAAERLARPALAPLRTELWRRFLVGDTPASLTLKTLDDEARKALADLLALDRLPADRYVLRVAKLLRSLGLDTVDDLRTAVEARMGPIPDLRAERTVEAAARDSVWSWLEREAAEVPLLSDDAARVGWLANVRAQGMRGGIDEHRRRLSRALAVLRALPADGIALASLSASKAGGPHNLDRGRSVAALVLDAVAAVGGHDRPRDAAETRACWESVGVVCDQLSSTVLVLGLEGGDDDTPVGRVLAASSAAREPVVLTLSQLRRWPRPPLPSGRCAYVFENPSVIAEAVRADFVGPPLVCGSGRPTVAVVTLLRQLGASGATLYQHADRDPAGMAITAWLADRAGTTPWRMDVSDGGDAIYEEDLAAELLEEIRHR